MKNLRLKVFLSMLLSILWISGISSIALAQASQTTEGRTAQTHHVLLISVDGLHAVDLARYVSTHPTSTLASLSKTGTTYNTRLYYQAIGFVPWPSFHDDGRHATKHRCILRRFL
jgi:predicted AlkP superfamily pyrophosphatase or phosphodiesterase